MCDLHNLLTITGAARLMTEVGVRRSPSTMRWYGDTGRLPVQRLADGTRVFHADDVRKLADQLSASNTSSESSISAARRDDPVAV